MLDKKSEEVLKFLISKYDTFNAKGYPIYLTAKDFSISESELDQLCLFLEENVLITRDPHSKSRKIYLTHQGLHYFENKKAERCLYFKQLALSKSSDVFVSFLTALVTYFLMPYLTSLLK